MSNAQLFTDLSTSYKDILNLIHDDRHVLTEYPTLCRMEIEAVSLSDCFGLIRTLKQKRCLHEKVSLVEVMTAFALADRCRLDIYSIPLATQDDIMEVPNEFVILQGTTRRLYVEQILKGAFVLQKQYDIANMRFAEQDNNQVCLISQHRVKGQIKLTDESYKRIKMQEYVFDLTKTTHKNIKTLDSYTDNVITTPFYINESYMTKDDEYNPFNRAYEAELHKRFLLPTDVYLSDVLSLTAYDHTAPYVRVWVGENEIMKGAHVESVYQKRKTDVLS